MNAEKTDRLAKIMNRSLSQHEINKLNAMAGFQDGVQGDEYAESVKPLPKIETKPVNSESNISPKDDIEYIASIVSTFYKHFEKYGPSVSATLSLAACNLKGNAALALVIKDKDVVPAIPVKQDSPVIPGKKRGRPRKV